MDWIGDLWIRTAPDATEEGDCVLVIDEGNSGRQILGAPDAPVKTLVVGIIDHVEVEGEHVYNHCEGVGA